MSVGKTCSIIKHIKLLMLSSQRAENSTFFFVQFMVAATTVMVCAEFLLLQNYFSHFFAYLFFEKIMFAKYERKKYKTH